ncbi:MAG: calcium-translocating P-type ATPase, PMCA-type [Bacilli bacterium]|nr:calcium-translocating P-type ATPase, PMCA-type [Bacilli bacterium]
MREIGLTDKQVIESRLKNGSNKISIKKQNSFVKLFVESLGEPMTKILLIALAVKTLFLLRSFDWYETVGIAIAIFIASLISTLSEYGSEASFKKLQEEASKINCRVYRNGMLTEISMDDIVQNDVSLLQAGDKVPADGIIIKGSIEVDDSALNGESKEVTRDINDNKVLRGSVVCANEALMLVTSVGDKTVYGSIGLELQDEKREGPLKHRLRKLAKTISKLGYVGAFLVATSYLFDAILIKNGFDSSAIKTMFSNHHLMVGHLLHAITLAVTVIVVAVPEGLPMMITLVLSRNMKKMLKDNILVRKLLGIETFGSLNILFTDKTGTLTKGKLQVVNFIDGNSKEYSSNLSFGTSKLFELLDISLKYNNSATYDNEKKMAIGSNATDRALLEYVSSNKSNVNIRKEKQIPFNSKTKLSMTKVKGDYNVTLVKGMPEIIIDKCHYCYDESGNKKPFMNKSRLLNKMNQLSEKSIRFIAIATTNSEVEKNMELRNLTLVGIIGIRDEVREGVKESLDQVRKAGIQVVMITGDAKRTASAIASEIDLLDSNSLIINSDELSRMSDQYLKENLKRIRVVSRALPSDKSRLVRIAQELNLVVGMTGDGVNDAPAIKKADVGIAMGSGTEVAKEASDIVILDNNFESISKAILYGRTIFKNIRKFIILQLTINMCAVGISIIGPFIGIEDPITVVQMLWVNMVMDTLAALAFAGEPALKEYMDEAPKRRNENIINRYMFGQIVFTGLYSFILCLLFIKLPIMKIIFIDDTNGLHLMTAFFALFIFIGIFNCFNARTHRLNVIANITRNRGFMFIMLLITVIQVCIIYYGGTLFRVIGLNAYELILVILISLTVIPVDWVRKIWLKKHHKNTGV